MQLIFICLDILNVHIHRNASVVFNFTVKLPRIEIYDMASLTDKERMNLNNIYRDVPYELTKRKHVFFNTITLAVIPEGKG